MKLYEITADYDRLISMDMESDEDISAFKELLSSIQGAFDIKAESCCKMIRNIESEAEAFKVEKERLAKKQKQAENKSNEIKKYLQYEASKIIEAGASRKVGTFTLSIRNNPEALVIDRDGAIPAGFCFTRMELDKELLKECLKNGETVEGCRLTRGTSLRIS